ncbi:competence protein ComK [Alkalihalobacillus sp. TS-13]|uniref:competence protein ComK n=1 Tax=Alkalihalobacillus sp. TS-13 TaxID=2842455 RepID=UPI001C8703F1|nr:competence protein ComK [Alkalihalobacillus sp. TS-13]
MGKMNGEEYLINGETMVILPHFDAFGNLHSLVIESERELIVKQKPIEIMKDSCLYYGSSLQGRVDGAIHVTKFSRMVPIMICNRAGIFFFPTQSSKSESCIWIAHSHVKEILPLHTEHCQVVLTNNKTVPVQVTKAVMESKVNRAAQYRHLVNQQQLAQQLTCNPMNLDQLVALESTGAYTFTQDHLELN